MHLEWAQSSVINELGSGYFDPRFSTSIVPISMTHLLSILDLQT